MRIPKDEIEDYLEKWNGLGKYVEQERALNELYDKYLGRFDLEALLVKCSALNTFYATSIWDIHAVAKYYAGFSSLKEDLDSGDIFIVEKIKKVNGRTNYSFATKFCSRHNPLAFPIYDSFVARLLCKFRNEDGFCKFNNDKLRNYISYKEIYDEFIKYYGLEKYTYKQIDMYLWQAGKEEFKK